MDDVPLVVLTIILVAFSAFFSCSETAFTSASRVRLGRLSKSSSGARLALFLLSRYDRLISAVVIGNDIVNIAASSVFTLICVRHMGESVGSVVSTFVLAMILLIFGEIPPKAIGKKAPEKMCSLTSYLVVVFYFLFWPLTVLFEYLNRFVIFIFKLDKKGPTLTEDELKMIVSDIADEGVLEKDEHDLIQNSIIFDDKTIKQVMVPFDDVVKAYNDQSDFEIKEMFEVNNYSRVPYIDRDSGEILGILLQKDFYEMLLENNTDRSSLIQEPHFFQATMKVDEAFTKIQKTHIQMAFVIDKDQKTIGVISAEDLIEELVGEIEDEHDMEDEEERDLYSAKMEKEKLTKKSPVRKAKKK